MLIILSPAKKQSFNIEHILNKNTFTQPNFLNKTADLIKILKNYSQLDIQNLMKLSSKLANLNYERYLNFDIQPNQNTLAQPAILAFQGDVYRGLDAQEFDQDEVNYAQDHLGILSGLYGFLKPLDLIQAHRLEMGTKLKNNLGKDLYDFWKKNLTDYINSLLEKNSENNSDNTLINLASNEYSSAIDFGKISGKIIKIDFKQFKDGQYKNIAIHAKRARGLMAKYAIKNKISNPEQLKQFNYEDYSYNSDQSNPNHWVFTRQI